MYTHIPPLFQGDGINYESLKGICENVKEKGWSLDNLAFGSGGGLLQKVHRDTQKCAFKCCYAYINGKDVCSLLYILSHYLDVVLDAYAVNVQYIV